MPTWCHMFNSTLIGTTRVRFDELPPKSIEGYTDLKAAFLAYFIQQKKYVKDPVVIHNIKQKDGETIKEFIERFKIETGRMKGAPKCMRISEFMHGVNNLELIKRLNEHVPKTLEEMMTATEAFILGEIVAASKKKVHTPWKSQDQSKRQSFERRSNFRNQPRDERGSNKFTLLTRTPKEIFAVESGKFKPPPPMARQRQQKTGKKDAPVKDKAATIYMIQPGQRVTRQRVTQSFAYVKEITFPPLTANKRAGARNQDSNGLGDYVANWFYWGNYMAARTDKALGNYRGRRALYKSMDEFYEMTIRSTILTPTEFTTIAATPKDHAKKAEARHKNFKVAIHPDFRTKRLLLEERMCVEFIDLNKACPQDCYPLSEIDWKVKSLCGYPFKCFMDAYKGYHHIQMAEQDEEKTAFHTSHGVYCYTKMPFGLKNAGATYQRLVDKAFDRQIGRNLEIYMDDLVIKSHTETELLQDIEVTFRTLRKINMNLILKNVRSKQ
nr:reverse transcriptase domain-containing protein [Tanacetum cinerariifolium]